MSDISIRTAATYLNEDQRWIGPGGISSMKDARSITLDRSGFDLVTAFPNGFIPSGVVLGKLTATGLYAPYVDGVGTGLQTAVGLLMVTVKMDPLSAATADVPAALYWKGEVVESMLPTGHGLDAAGKVDLKFIAFV
jgi:hypothetical protein